MSSLRLVLDSVGDFLARGGEVLLVITWVMFVMWLLIIERSLYLLGQHRSLARDLLEKLSVRQAADGWCATAVRRAAISRLDLRLTAAIPVIRTLAQICPLLGLLGTVTGMIVIFDVMATLGSSSPRAVAAGVAQATLTTLAGMVAALSGIFPAAWLARRASEEIASLQQRSVGAATLPPPRLPALRQPLRFLVAALLAANVTLALLFGMQQMIETGERAITRELAVYMPEFIRIPREESLTVKPPKPTRPPPPEPMPEVQLRPVEDSSADAVLSVDLPRSPPPLGQTLKIAGGTAFSIQDAEFMPLVKVLPIYPRRALLRGEEGWVLLRFTITASGRVKDIEVVESTDSIFERPSIEAAKKFKYQPRIVNGEPVEVTGVLHYVRFGIEEGQRGS